MMFVSTAECATSAPARLAAAVCNHLVEHDLRVVREDCVSVIEFAGGRGIIEVGNNTVLLRAEANDLAGLCAARSMLASHLIEFAGPDRPAIAWRGDGDGVTTPPNFREAVVVRNVVLTPGMRRITLAADDLGRFDAFDLHLKLLIPTPGIAPTWPWLGPDGLFRWAQDDTRPAVRIYTIRRIDVVRGEIDLDMVVHAPPCGPGTSFAVNARPGDRIGFVGPGGRNANAAEWYLLAGDETALPAIARILERAAPSAAGIALIEVADAAEEQTLQSPSGLLIHWLHRNGVAAGEKLTERVLRIARPAGRSVSCWAGAEFSSFRRIRSHWRSQEKLRREEHLCVSYWRQGHAS